MKNYKLLLLRFGEGGDGAGSAAGEGTASGAESGVDSKENPNIPASIPERGRKLFAEVLKENSAAPEEPKTEVKAEEVAKAPKLTYDEIIKSDDYKDAHKAYMEKAINDRIKKYKGQEKSLKEAMGLLNTIGTKYGLNSEDENYIAKLTEAVANDDSYYEKYAEEHDMTPAEARKIVTLERRVKENEAERARLLEEEQQRAQFEVVRQNAAKTQQLYPGFDLATEINNPAFMRILQSTNGDTTAAYVAVHHSEIMQGVAASAAQQAKIATANTIASGTQRVPENGMVATAPAASISAFPDFTKMKKEQLEAWADSQRRKR